MVRHVRFHGRGGAGVKLTARIVSRAAFLTGLTVQDSPLYGAERRGAPLVAFARFSPGAILERGYIDRADAVVLMDVSLLSQPSAAVLAGAGADCAVLINSNIDAGALRVAYGISGRLAALDVSAIALDHIGAHVLSAPMSAFAAKALQVAPWPVVVAAIRSELGDIGLPPEILERNVAAARLAYESAPALGFASAAAPAPVLGQTAVFSLPPLTAPFNAPSITAGATGVRRTTAGWRQYRPVIDLDRCTRCAMCFAFCPDGAITLDTSGLPRVDYAHCKGCLVCLEECPPRAIARQREASA